MMPASSTTTRIMFPRPSSPLRSPYSPMRRQRPLPDSAKLVCPEIICPKERTNSNTSLRFQKYSKKDWANKTETDFMNHIHQRADDTRAHHTYSLFQTKRMCGIRFHSLRQSWSVQYCTDFSPCSMHRRRHRQQTCPLHFATGLFNTGQTSFSRSAM